MIKTDFVRSYLICLWCVVLETKTAADNIGLRVWHGSTAVSAGGGTKTVKSPKMAVPPTSKM